MFRKILIANRGEIAVRILRACRSLGVSTVALYQPDDRGSLHVRLADECIELKTPAAFLDQDEILRIALDTKADAIHPGYGFLAEREDFIRRCSAAGVTFIGPPEQAVEAARQKIQALQRAEAAGFSTPGHSATLFTDADLAELYAETERLGFPLVVKSCRGGRGRGERLVWSPDRLEKAVRAAQTEAQAVYGDRRVYLEKVILPAHQIGVQVVGDRHGHLIHLGEREGSLRYGNQKLIEETPAPCLTSAGRQEIWQAALELARLFEFQNVGTVEFVVDGAGKFYFTEIKPRIQIEHPLSEIVSGVDLVREQIRVAAGEPLGFDQDEVHLEGWAMQSRISAEDPWRQYLPNPGYLHMVRLPGGPGVRVDTYVYCGCYIPAEYDPLIAKLVTWGSDRQQCLERQRQALRETQLTGTPTNLPLIQRILSEPSFIEGRYTTELLPGPVDEEVSLDDEQYRDLAAIAAVAFLRQRQVFRPVMPDRVLGGWHRDSRRLPQ
jgi:acetyl-CoA carboxylase, biotin carboxylase subunit